MEVRLFCWRFLSTWGLMKVSSSFYLFLCLCLLHLSKFPLALSLGPCCSAVVSVLSIMLLIVVHHKQVRTGIGKGCENIMLIFYVNQRSVESLSLKNASWIPPAHSLHIYWPCPLVLHLHCSWVPAGTVTPPSPWAASATALLLFWKQKIFSYPSTVNWWIQGLFS